MVSIGPVAPLLATAALLLASNGVQSTMLTLRADLEGFATTTVGLMGAAYFFGFLVGTWAATRLIAAVGHIRVFASLAAASAAITLLFPVFISEAFWIFARVLLGFCAAGLFTVVESWINGAANNADRGRIISVYRIVDLMAVTGSQLFLPVVGIEGFEVFSTMAVLMCLSLIPIALSVKPAPKVRQTAEFDIAAVWRISPLAVIGVFAIGLTTSSFRLVGPLYASEIGFDLESVATFMAVGIIGGAALQYPLGFLSDRFDRRQVLILATLCAAGAGFLISQIGASSPWLAYVGIFLFGAFALPLYSLSMAHANDFARPEQYALLSAGLLFIYALGAIIGPLGGSLVIEYFGPSAFFAYVGLVHLALVAVAAFRALVGRRTVPSEDRVPYVPMLRTSVAFARLARGRPDAELRPEPAEPHGTGAPPPRIERTATSDT